MQSLALALSILLSRYECPICQVDYHLLRPSGHSSHSLDRWLTTPLSCLVAETPYFLSEFCSPSVGRYIIMDVEEA